MRRIFENKKIVGIYNDYFDYIKITFLILLIIGLLLSFFFSPSDYLQGEVVRIMLSLIHISEPTRRTTISYAVFCFKKNFFNDTATTEIYTWYVVGSVRCV